MQTSSARSWCRPRGGTSSSSPIGPTPEPVDVVRDRDVADACLDTAQRVTVVAFEQVSADAEVPDVPTKLAVEPAKLDLVEDLLAEIGERRIDGRPVVAKFRTGGTTANAFPSEEDLAYFILASFNAGVPFKLTAGLHHAHPAHRRDHWLRAPWVPQRDAGRLARVCKVVRSRISARLSSFVTPNSSCRR